MSSIVRINEVKYYQGLEADLPSALQVGDEYFATDTKKTYRFEQDGTFVLISESGVQTLKEMNISVTQVGTSAPTLTLINNNSSLNFDNIITTIRLSEGSYEFGYSTSDNDLFDKIFLEIKGLVSEVSLLNGIEKGNVIVFGIRSYDLNSNSFQDNIFNNNLLTIYVNE